MPSLSYRSLFLRIGLPHIHNISFSFSFTYLCGKYSLCKLISHKGCETAQKQFVCMVIFIVFFETLLLSLPAILKPQLLS